MSGLNEIIQWVQSEIILDPTQSVDEQFADISAEFKKDNRLPLADILLDELPQFFKFLESESGAFTEPTDGERFEPLESRIRELESDIERVSRQVREEDIVRGGLDELFTEFGQIIRGRESVVLPKGFKAVEPDIITREFIESFEPEQDILTKVVNFFKGLFR